MRGGKIMKFIAIHFVFQVLAFFPNLPAIVYLSRTLGSFFLYLVQSFKCSPWRHRLSRETYSILAHMGNLHAPIPSFLMLLLSL